MFFLGAVTLTLTLVAIVPSWREKMRRTVQPNTREILAAIEGDLHGNERPVRVYKVRTPEGLYLEIYEIMEGGYSGNALESLKLPDKKEGYFTFMNRTTNLAISDVDSDGTMELIAPSFDDNLIARLNVYRYNKSTQKMERITPQQLGFR